MIAAVSPTGPAELSARDARRLTESIRSALRASLEGLAAARAGRADAALGYPTWHDYVEAEFGSLAELRLPVTERRALVASMSAADLSTREQARRLGVSVGTVHGDRHAHRPALTVVDGDPYAGMTRAAEALARIRAAGNRGLTSTELQAATRWPLGSASAALSKLEARGLVHRPGLIRAHRGAYFCTGVSVAAAPSA